MKTWPLIGLTRVCVTGLVEENPNFCIVLSEKGSHCSFAEGMFGQRSFMYRTALDFFQAAHRDFEYESSRSVR